MLKLPFLAQLYTKDELRELRGKLPEEKLVALEEDARCRIQATMVSLRTKFRTLSTR